MHKTLRGENSELKVTQEEVDKFGGRFSINSQITTNPTKHSIQHHIKHPHSFSPHFIILIIAQSLSIYNHHQTTQLHPLSPL